MAIQRLSAALVKYMSAFAGAIGRSLKVRLEDRVSVLDFGADPTGQTDSSAAFQAACDVGKVVLIPKGIYLIQKTIVLKRSVVLVGEGNEGLINRAMSFINVDGNIPLFSNWQEVDNPNSMFQCHAKRLFVQYNPTTRPETTEGNSNKVAFNFYSTVAEKNGLEFCSFEDITVLGAWAAYWDRSGTYMTSLKRFEARSCRFGFLKATGTTITLENCYANSCVTSFQFGAMSTVVMTNCAMDNTDIKITNGSLGYAGLHMTNVRCFIINGFDAEVNRVSTDGGSISSLMHFEESTGTVQGIVGLHNDLVTEGAGLAGTVALIRASSSSHVKIVGSEGEFFRNESIQYSGNGYALTVISDETSKVTVEDSKMSAPVAKSGSPILLGLSQGNVTWVNCRVSGGIYSGGSSVNYTANGVVANGFLTATGSVEVSAIDTPTAMFNLPSGYGAYLVSAWGVGSGVNYSVSAQIVYNGNPAVQHIYKGAFLTIDATDRTVTLSSKGSGTFNWSYVKIG